MGLPGGDRIGDRGEVVGEPGGEQGRERLVVAALRRGERVDQLLNWLYIKPGEMIYNPAGTVHAIGPGSVLVEIQQNSDSTYRLYDYGRERELHLEPGLQAMRERTGAGRVVTGSQKGMLAVSPWFRVEKFLVEGESVQFL